MSKIDQNLINNLFSQKIGYPRKEVLKGPEYGVDCAVVELTDNKVMVMASDPLSYIPRIGIKESAYISLHITANDIATAGLLPQYGQFVLNLPSSVSKLDLEEYWSFISEFAHEIGVHITGGHTGWDASNHTTIAGGVTLFATGEKKDIMLSSQAEVNDVLLMTKSAGIISTSILGMSFPNYVEQHLGADVLLKLSQNIWNISVLPESKIIQEINTKSSGIHAMHDVTEGGVLGAIYEFATASNLGAKVFSEQIHVEEEISLAAKLFELDPREIIGAGCMLIACKDDVKDEVVVKLAKSNIRCTEIGHFCAKEEGIQLYTDAGMKAFQVSPQDSYWQVFTNCMHNGLS
jgi:hydrogenase expression/formation protein HypE